MDLFFAPNRRFFQSPFSAALLAATLTGFLGISQAGTVVNTVSDPCDDGGGSSCRTVKICNTDSDSTDTDKTEWVMTTKVANEEAYRTADGEFLQATYWEENTNLTYGECIKYTIPLPDGSWEYYEAVTWKASVRFKEYNYFGSYDKDWGDYTFELESSDTGTLNLDTYYKSNKNKTKVHLAD